MQIFHPMFSMLYTGNSGLRYCVGFSQIRSHIVLFCKFCLHILCTHHCAIATPIMYQHLATSYDATIVLYLYVTIVTY